MILFDLARLYEAQFVPFELGQIGFSGSWMQPEVHLEKPAPRYGDVSFRTGLS